jgi:aminoglycoside phosphotransferase (APT) family kinase protein
VEPAPLANRHHGWIWAALPADCRLVLVVGDPELAASLRSAGLEVEVEGGPPARSAAGHAGPQTTVVALGRLPTPVELAAAIAELEPSDAFVLALPEDGRRTAMILRRLREAGLEASALAVGAGPHRRAPEWARAAFARRARPAVRAVVLGGHPPVRSLLDEVAARAAHAIGQDLARRSVTVLSTGTVLAELAAPTGDRFALRLGGGPAADLLVRSGDNVAALLAAGAPSAVRERLPVPLARGSTGPVRWTLEHWVSGRHPVRMSTRLWNECLGFIVALHRAPERAPGGTNGAAWSLEPDLRALEQHADDRGRHTLARLEAELLGRLANVPRGWAHGDFWPANLVVDGDRLLAVLDWDSACAGAPAMLDLMHLLLLSDRRTRRLPHGSRSIDVLLPLAQGGGDARMRRYCAATATPGAASTLEGLALAYWVSRVGRDLRTYQNRPGRRAWMDANLHRPLEELARAGW